MKQIKKLKIGLALGGGGARGCAHIGVIKALKEAGIEIHCIAGTSIGSVVGAIYSAGDLDAFEDFLINLKKKDVLMQLDPVIPKMGFLEGQKVSKLLQKFIPKPVFGSCKIPFQAVATDLFLGTQKNFSEGNLIDAIRASISIPGIFTPFKKGTHYYVDGGVLNPVPVDVAKSMGADIVIAVDLNHAFKGENRIKKIKEEPNSWFSSNEPNILDVLECSVFMMQNQISQKNLLIYPAEILIQPELESASLFDFHKAKRLIEIGYKTTKKVISGANFKRFIQSWLLSNMRP